MRKPFASLLGCCAAALPLIGCAGSLTAPPPHAGLPPATVSAAGIPEQSIHTARGGSPAAVLVFMPGMVELGDVAIGDPALWTAQGFDVVMPSPPWTERLIADQQAAVERLLASAQALADVPVWLVGPSPAIEAVMPQLGPGQISGVVVTSVRSNDGSCSRTIYYSSPGNGAEPKAMIKVSGDACGPSPAFGTPQVPTGALPAPQVKPPSPRFIETSIPADPNAQRPVVERLAEEIKAPQPAS